MICPECEGPLRIASTHRVEPQLVKRYRECEVCQHRETTFEFVIDGEDAQLIKTVYDLTAVDKVAQTFVKIEQKLEMSNRLLITLAQVIARMRKE